MLEDRGSTWHEIVRAVFVSRDAALETAAKRFSDEELEEGRTLAAIPTSYFKPRRVQATQVRSVKWEDG